MNIMAAIKALIVITVLGLYVNPMVLQTAGMETSSHKFMDGVNGMFKAEATRRAALSAEDLAKESTPYKIVMDKVCTGIALIFSSMFFLSSLTTPEKIGVVFQVVVGLVVYMASSTPDRSKGKGD